MTETWTPLKLRSANEGIIFEGEASGAGGGGGAAVQAVYTGNNVLINNGGSTSLTFDTLLSGTELLDRTDPTSPTLLAAGAYAFTVFVIGDTLTAAGYALVTIGDGTLGLETVAQTPNPDNGWGASVTFVAAAGDGIVAAVQNADGVSSRNFNLNAGILVRL